MGAVTGEKQRAVEIGDGGALRDAARAAGFGVMVGCMVGSSLAMAPAVLVAQGAAVTDLDGPLLLARDRAHPLVYDEAGVHPPTPELWG
jgi:L-alanine-DL-glutamate epimerase-like enolase superfamily enzyme